jgi:hypothetical protein
MGYYTRFWGSLKFTGRLTELELQTVESIIDAGHTARRKIEAVIERECEQRRKPGRAEIIDVGNEIMRRAELQGFIAPKGWPDHIDLCITGDRRGLCYCAEKTYTMVEAVNFVIANGRQRIRILA